MVNSSRLFRSSRQTVSKADLLHQSETRVDGINKSTTLWSACKLVVACRRTDRHSILATPLIVHFQQALVPTVSICQNEVREFLERDLFRTNV